MNSFTKHPSGRPPARAYVFAATLALMLTPLVAAAQPGGADTATTLAAPDGTTVVIYRDHYGVPHIRAASEVGVFFGQGYAEAEDRLFQMELFRRAALGRLSEVGLAPQATDRQIRTVFYTAAERDAQFTALRPEVQAMLSSYVAGVNAYLAVMASDPLVYQPAEFFALGFTPEPWTVNQAVAVAQFFMRRSGERGGRELERLAELQTFGPAWFEANRPINDPDVPVTIPDDEAPAPPALKRSPTAASAGVELPDVSAALRESISRDRAMLEDELVRIGAGGKLGSFAVVVDEDKSASGDVLMLGGPQLTPPEVISSTNDGLEVELDCPTFHAAGFTIAGLPGVIAGRTDRFAWSLTTGNTDNVDLFIEFTNADGTGYFFNGEVVPYEVFVEPDLGNYVHLRSVHGAVVGFDPAAGQAVARNLPFWNEELKMVEAFYDVWRATDIDTFEEAIRDVPMGFNVFYAGTDRRVGYWHLGKFPIRQGDPRLPQLGDGSQEWAGFIPFEALPKATDPAQGFYANWNNKPVWWWNQGDNMAWTTTYVDPNRPDRAYRVQVIDDIVRPDPDISFDELREVPRRISEACIDNGGTVLIQCTPRGTYEQVVEIGPDRTTDMNIVAPGQSAFVNVNGQPSPHYADQWGLYETFNHKDMVMNTPIRLWPPNHKYTTVDVADVVDYFATSDARVETVWSDEPEVGDESTVDDVLIPDERTVQVRVERDGEGNGRVYTVHVAAPNALGATGTAALFQVVVPHDSSGSSPVVDDGPTYRVPDALCKNCAEVAPEGAAATSQVGAAPDRYSLNQNYPNPFNPATTLSFALPETQDVVLAVYDMLGRQVAVLVDGTLNAGMHTVRWDAAGLPGGVYAARLEAGAFSQTRMMQLIK